jgi:hypothetical protein
MEHAEIAERAGVTIADLEDLLKGRATANVARRFGVSIMDVQDFIRGRATSAMAQRLGFHAMTAAEELAKAAGGVGILIGYMLNM